MPGRPPADKIGACQHCWRRHWKGLSLCLKMSRTPSPHRSWLLWQTKKLGKSGSSRSGRSSAGWRSKRSKKTAEARRRPWTSCFDSVTGNAAVLALLFRFTRRHSAGREPGFSSVPKRSIAPRLAVQETGRRRERLLGTYRSGIQGAGGDDERSRHLVLDRQPRRIRPASLIVSEQSRSSRPQEFRIFWPRAEERSRRQGALVH